MVEYSTLKALKRAFRNGDLPEDVRVEIGYTTVNVWKIDVKLGQRVLVFTSTPADLLGEAMELLDIPVEWV